VDTVQNQAELYLAESRVDVTRRLAMLPALLGPGAPARGG
jgi:hypothetical protein